MSVDVRSANAPRWLAGVGGWYEAWFIVASDPQSGAGVWLRYAIDVDRAGAVTPSLWGSFFPRGESGRSFSIRTELPAAAIRRADDLTIGLADAQLGDAACTGQVEAGGHSLRWRLALTDEPGVAPQQVSPGFLQPIARLKQSGYVLARPALRLSGELEVDGEPLQLRAAPGLQAHLWGLKRYPAWAWAHCSRFAEAADASLDLLSVQGPGGVFIPLYSFHFQGKLHRFAELPWIFRCSSRRTSPAWHFAAEDATLAIDGVVRAEPDSCVEVEYLDPDGARLYCVNSELADVELRVRTRRFPGAPWRPEGTLRSTKSAGVEFCGPRADARVSSKMLRGSSPTPAGR